VSVPTSRDKAPVVGSTVRKSATFRVGELKVWGSRVTVKPPQSCEGYAALMVSVMVGVC